MAGRLWSILIVPGSSGGFAQFVPDIPMSNLQAQQNDLLCWNNQTNQQHQPAISDTEPLSNLLDPFTSTEVAYEVLQTPPTIIRYYCLNHPHETGTVEVVK